MGLFTGTTSNTSEISKMDNTPASSSTGGSSGNSKQSNNPGDSAMSKGSDSITKPSQAINSKTAAENDPYEFMSGSSKEPTPDKVTDTGEKKPLKLKNHENACFASLE